MFGSNWDILGDRWSTSKPVIMGSPSQLHLVPLPSPGLLCSLGLLWFPMASPGLHCPPLPSSALPCPPLASLQPSPMYHDVVTSCTIIVSSLNSVNLLAFASLVWQLGIHCVLVAPWMSLPQDSVILSSSLPLLFIKCLASCVLLFCPPLPFPGLLWFPMASTGPL